MNAWAPAEAANLHAKAVAGDAESQALLGDALRWGDWGFKANRDEADLWTKRSAEQGHPLGVYLEGERQFLVASAVGELLPRIAALKRVQGAWTAAVEALLALAEAGGPHYWYIIARANDQGRGVEQDAGKAKEWYLRAANAGHTRAMVRLGSISQRLDTPEKWEDGIRWFQQAAELGSASGMVNLGFAYREGRGVDVDQREATRWFEAAVAAGDGHAMIHVGRMYDRFLSSPQLAVQWFRRAAEHGFKESHVELAMLYDDPTGGVYDPVEAVRWFRQVVEDGGSSVGRAMLALGKHYRDGNGVDLDSKIARDWLKKVKRLVPQSSAWHKEASKTLSEMDQSLF